MAAVLFCAHGRAEDLASALVIKLGLCYVRPLLTWYTCSGVHHLLMTQARPPALLIRQIGAAGGFFCFSRRPWDQEAKGNNPNDADV